MESLRNCRHSPGTFPREQVLPGTGLPVWCSPQGPAGILQDFFSWRGAGISATGNRVIPDLRKIFFKLRFPEKIPEIFSGRIFLRKPAAIGNAPK